VCLGGTALAWWRGMRLDLEGEYLRAARELCLRGDELLLRVAAAIRCDPYDYWILGRRPALDWAEVRVVDTPEQLDNDGEWSWFFHGLELDLIHLKDDRRVRVDFARDNLRGLFSNWGLESFVKHTCPPWPRYSRLCHPLMPSGLLDQLARTLRREGYLDEADRAHGAGHGFVLSAKAHEYLVQEPRFLGPIPA
jgi:hypothetical protein